MFHRLRFAEHLSSAALWSDSACIDNEIGQHNKCRNKSSSCLWVNFTFMYVTNGKWKMCKFIRGYCSSMTDYMNTYGLILCWSKYVRLNMLDCSYFPQHDDEQSANEKRSCAMCKCHIICLSQNKNRPAAHFEMQ